MTSLLLLHGFTGTPGSWDAACESLPPELSVVRPWLTGHGRPEAAPEIASFEAEVDRLAALVTGPFVVAGYSLGGRLAFGLLARHRKRIRAAVIISASAGLESAEQRDQRSAADRTWIELLENQGLESFVSRWEAQPLFKSQRAVEADLRRAERDRRLAHSAAGLARSLRVTGTGAMPWYGPSLSELSQRIELLTGALDAKFCAINRGVARTLRHAVHREAAGAGHNLLLERPELVAAAISRGLQS